LGLLLPFGFSSSSSLKLINSGGAFLDNYFYFILSAKDIGLSEGFGFGFTLFFITYSSSSPHLF